MYVVLTSATNILGAREEREERNGQDARTSSRTSDRDRARGNQTLGLGWAALGKVVLAVEDVRDCS